jgi:hypothetical protein
VNRLPHRFPRYGTLGLLTLLLMETAVFCNQSEIFPEIPWWRIARWATPVCWWSYILIVDAWIYRRKGASLLTARRELLALLCLVSIGFWCVFEAYNRVLPGWRYVNLSANQAERLLGYAVSFATILPAIFLTCELFQSYRAFSGNGSRTWVWPEWALDVSIWLGAACCVLPAVLPVGVRGYLWGFVWVGWLLMIEPINYRRAMPSLYRDWERGDWARTIQLMAAGAVCGLLWEFWNMWAYTKWVYIFPPGLSGRYFEMPVIGFLGFLPFALDCFATFHFVAGFYTRQDKLGI